MSDVIRREVGTPNPPVVLTIRSKILGEDRRVYIQCPVDFEESKGPYPVLLVLDGEWVFEVARGTVRFLSEYDTMDRAIPHMLVVGIENIDRDRDYVPTPDPAGEPEFPTAGAADAFLRFLGEELFPLLEADFRAAPARCVVGWSFGGLLALYSAVHAPELFDAYLCIGPAVWWDGQLVVDQLLQTEFDRPKRMVITLGTEEKGGSVYEATTRLLDGLAANSPENLTIAHYELEGVGHSWGIPTALDKGLRTLFAEYVPLANVEEMSLDELEARYDRLSMTWRFPVTPPPDPCQAIAVAEWKAGNHDQALKTVDRIIKKHPNYSYVQFQKAAYLSREGRYVEALDVLHAAEDVELRRAVPSGVRLRQIREEIAKMGAQLAS